MAQLKADIGSTGMRSRVYLVDDNGITYDIPIRSMDISCDYDDFTSVRIEALIQGVPLLLKFQWNDELQTHIVKIRDSKQS